MIQDLIIAGFGGQGIMSIGKILALAGMLDDKNVTWFPSYGAEMRGGTANCTVIVSDRAIGSPIVARPWAAIVMNQPSLEKFAPLVKEGGVLLINSSLAGNKIETPMNLRFTKENENTQRGFTDERKDIETIRIPATEMADKLGSVKVANIIALAAFCAKTEIVSIGSLEKAMERSFSSKDAALLRINRLAAYSGREHILVNK
ncbi:2-oxoacid:acceptor oxidoreductase family protein [bacterium]|nr:2-oxoacid:acceptor oxidoreductase family protein [bacterium]